MARKKILIQENPFEKAQLFKMLGLKNTYTFEDRHELAVALGRVGELGSMVKNACQTHLEMLFR